MAVFLFAPFMMQSMSLLVALSGQTDRTEFCRLLD